jgi:hypothetical protein
VLRVPNLDGDVRRVHGSLSWFGHKKALRPAGGKYCIFLHLSDCIGVTSCERGSRSQVSERKMRVQRRLLEVLIFYGGVATGSSLFPPLVESPAFTFIGSRGGRDVGGCLSSEVLSSAVEAAVATCSENGQPSPDTMVT